MAVWHAVRAVSLNKKAVKEKTESRAAAIHLLSMFTFYCLFVNYVKPRTNSITKPKRESKSPMARIHAKQCGAKIDCLREVPNSGMSILDKKNLKNGQPKFKRECIRMTEVSGTV